MRLPLFGRNGPLLLVLALPLVSCDYPSGTSEPVQPVPLIPLNELLGSSYLGLEGGLYPGGVDDVPPRQDSVGLQRGNQVQPLGLTGNPSPSGKYVLLSIGMGEATQDFCSGPSTPPCNPWSFMGQAAQDTTVNHTTLVIVNGARDKEEASHWEATTSTNYDRIRDSLLTPSGLSELQVQAVWIQVSNAIPKGSLPGPGSDAEILAGRLGNIVRALRARYGNIRQVFLSSRIYADYAQGLLFREPFAYETGFGVKALLTAQIVQMSQSGGPVSVVTGNVNYDTVAPWLAWGPYTWADGATPRGDGLTWERTDFEANGADPSQSGETKVADMLLAFFKQSPYTRCWFLKSAPVCA